MSDVLAMDFYRLRKGKAFGIICIVAAVVTLIGVASLAAMQKITAIAEEYELSGDLIDVVIYSLPTTYTGYMEAFFHGNYTTLYIVIWALLFYGAEYRNGYIKNAITRERGFKMILSRLVLIAVVSLIVYLIVAVIVTLGCLLMGIFDAGEFGPLVRIFFIGVLLNTAVASVAVMIFAFWQKTLPAMISGICYVMVGSELLTLVGWPVRILSGNENFDLNKYLCIGNILVYLTTEETAATYIRMIVIGIVVLVGSVVLSAVAVKKKDIL